VLAASLFDRFRSRQEHTFGEKVLSAMRYKFGGHVELRPPASPADQSPAEKKEEQP
jgi:6-phosphogluconate dehydrogenase